MQSFGPPTTSVFQAVSVRPPVRDTWRLAGFQTGPVWWESSLLADSAEESVGRSRVSRRCLHLHLFRATYESYVCAACSKRSDDRGSLLAWAALQDSAAPRFNQSWRSRPPPKSQSLTE